MSTSNHFHFVNFNAVKPFVISHKTYDVSKTSHKEAYKKVLMKKSIYAKSQLHAWLSQEIAWQELSPLFLLSSPQTTTLQPGERDNYHPYFAIIAAIWGRNGSTALIGTVQGTWQCNIYSITIWHNGTLRLWGDSFFFFFPSHCQYKGDMIGII